jgi:RNA polymerase sigma-70 factor (ECF subfamily)
MKNPRITAEEVDLIKKAQAGDELAFNALYYKYKGFVENLLFQYLKDMDESKDVANIVFLKVHDKLSKFTAYESFGGWLRILTNHTAIDYLRSQKNERSASDIKEERLPSNIQLSAEDDLVNHIAYKDLLSEFNKLPEVTRKIFTMFYVNNNTIEEISNTFNPAMPIGTIKSTLSRTRRKLKKRLKLKL